MALEFGLERRKSRRGGLRVGPELPDHAVQGVVGVALAGARGNGRDELEPGNAGRPCQAGLVAVEMAPEHCRELHLEAASDFGRRPFVSRQREVELLVGDAVGDRRHGIQPRTAWAHP